MATNDDSSSISSIGKEKLPEEAEQPQQRNHPLKQWQSINRSPTQRTAKYLEGADLINLPSRTLGNNADLEEYTEETAEGQILKEVKSNKTGLVDRYELITWKINDPENPKNWSKAYKWWCTMTVAMTCFVVALNSAVITADIKGPAEEFGVSEEVALLSITLFVMGFGIGKLLPNIFWFDTI
jgi:hypothetical protein